MLCIWNAGRGRITSRSMRMAYFSKDDNIQVNDESCNMRIIKGFRGHLTSDTREDSDRDGAAALSVPHRISAKRFR
jgi:hypothetical protein